jgi:tRNA pseudouridine38-40 synthase
MVAHFDYDSPLDGAAVTDKLNRLLPPDIAVYRVVPVKPEAHARFDATWRTYHYFVTTRKDPFTRQYAWRLFHTPDFQRMNEAARTLFDYTDFTSFSKLHTDVKTNNCRIMQAEWTQVGPTEWRFTIQADRFLRNMVRAVVGTLMEVGRGKMTVDEFRRVIEAKNRCSAGSSVPGNALFLVDVGYPEELFL